MARLIIGAVALSVALAGCGGDPKADPAPSPTGVETTTPVGTTPTPPAMPAAAKANTKAGAIAFVRHYIEVLNFAQATGDIGGLWGLEDPECKSCRRVRQYIADVYAHGGTIQGGRWLVKRISANRGYRGAWVIDVEGTFEASQVVPTPGASPRPAEGGPAPTTFFVERKMDWVVKKWTRGI